MEKKNIKNNSMANNSSKGIASPLPREGAGVGSKSVVVAFSGGLDTSYTVMKLTQEGWDVYAACPRGMGRIRCMRQHRWIQC